jgi:hypothetical protein
MNGKSLLMLGLYLYWQQQPMQLGGQGCWPIYLSLFNLKMAMQYLDGCINLKPFSKEN